ncbi:MAG: ribosome silencing factor [Steroidobacteraceae bacterium]
MTATRKKSGTSKPKNAKTARAAAPKRRKSKGVADIALEAIEDMKGVNVKVVDVRGVTDIADTMIIASGTSDRHVRSIAGRVVEKCKAAGHLPLGVEGEREGEWVLVDLQDVIVHLMLPRIREFYGLEKLWDLRPRQREASAV